MSWKWLESWISGRVMAYCQISGSGYNPPMGELISVIAFFTGIPLFIIGWVMSIIAAKKLGAKWVVGMVLLVPAFPVTLILLALIHWNLAKKPLLFTLVGTILILITLYYIPEQQSVTITPGN